MRLAKIGFICSIFIVLATFSTTVFADQATVNADYLNVRSGPGTDFDKIKQVHTNEVYPIIQVQGEWVEIQLDGQSGWITTEYITMKQEDTGENNTEENSKKTYAPNSSKETEITILSNNTQIRKGASVDHDIILFAKKDTTFEVISEDEDWYEIKTEDGTGYVYKKLVDKQQSTTNHLKNKTIVIDAGHGGRDVGAISSSGLYEKDFTMRSANELKETLTKLGANVILTRKNDEYIRLASRPTLSNFYQADAFISIHYNSFPELASVTGIDTYYFDDDDERLARIIQQEVINETRANDRGIDFGDFQVIRQNLQPAILLELGFISNHAEEQLLLTNAYQKKIVKGIVSGLTKYFAN